ncbi:MAG TPA: dipeptide ABC transporter ATP-binding protein [Acetobacteraceae bacterium]|nr:dipeptide ABC transporter ATP-binding protein [Acetobacteraceae bacterium]
MLEVENLTIAFGSRRVVDRVGFTLERGETLALVGESGSGKSLTALSILQLLPPGAACSGRVVLDGQDMLTASPQTLQQARGGTAGIVFQEPMTSLNPLHRLGRQVAEAMALHGRRPTREAVADLLARVGFADATSRLDAFPHQLSGGQRQRVMIAMALANDPKLLIADEPTTALDVTIQAGILDLLAAEKRRRGLALLLISHDLNVVRRVADRVCVMKDGELVETGPVERVFRAPQHPYTRMLIDAEPSGAPQPVPQAAPVVAEARELGVTFAVRRGVLRRKVAEVRAVDGVSLEVREGETLGLVGESGSGKSTIGLAMLRLQPATGRVLFEGSDITVLRQSQIRPLRRRMQIVFQDPYGSLSPRMSVAEIIAEGLRVHEPSLTRRARMDRVHAALAEVGLAPDSADRYPHEFSGGQRQRIAVARAMVLKPRLVVLDEPTSALDRSVQSQLVDLLRGLQQAHGLAYLFISHDLAVVRALAHRVAVLQAGRVVEQGPADALFARPKTAYAAALMAAAFSAGAGVPEAAPS